MTKTITIDQAEHIVYHSTTKRIFVDHRRWNVNFLIVYEEDNKYWGFYYDAPATESQESSLWDMETVEVFEVEKVPSHTYQRVETT